MLRLSENLPGVGSVGKESEVRGAENENETDWRKFV